MPHSNHPLPTDPGREAARPADRAAVDDALGRIRAAWDAGDADAYAAEFTDDASYVIFAGIASLGRDAIRAAHVPVFQKWQRGTRMAMRVIDVRFTGRDTAVVVTEGGIGKGARVALDKVQTFVLVREGELWRCAAFQNTRKNRLFMAMNRRALAAA